MSEKGSSCEIIEKSIFDWIDKLRKTILGEKITIGKASCRLCHVYFSENGCNGCPIFKDIKNPTCQDAPLIDKVFWSPEKTLDMVKYLIGLRDRVCSTCKDTYETFPNDNPDWSGEPTLVFIDEPKASCKEDS